MATPITCPTHTGPTPAPGPAPIAWPVGPPGLSRVHGGVPGGGIIHRPEPNGVGGFVGDSLRRLWPHAGRPGEYGWY